MSAIIMNKDFRQYLQPLVR